MVVHYKKEFCQRLITHMEGGLSFDAFAGLIGTTRKTLYEWLSKHSEFSYAKQIAEPKGRLFWESVGLQACTGGIDSKQFSAVAWIFTMKNRFGWRNIEETHHTLSPSALSRMPTEQLNAMVVEALEQSDKEFPISIAATSSHDDGQN